MGCVVNGPGEAKEADLGIAGGDDVGLLIKHWRGCKESTGDGTSGYTSPGTSYLE